MPIDDEPLPYRESASPSGAESPVIVRLTRRGAGWWTQATRVPALFLDRDGIVNVDTGYVGRAEDVVILPATAAAVRQANAQGIPVVVVSNQSGVARGYFGWDAVVAVDERIATLFAAEGAGFDLVVYAGAGPEAGDRFRKPEPGMFDLAARLLPIDLARSWMVGDKVTDLEAAARAGLTGGVFHDSDGTGTLATAPWRANHPLFLAAVSPNLPALLADVLGRLRK